MTDQHRQIAELTRLQYQAKVVALKQLNDDIAMLRTRLEGLRQDAIKARMSVSDEMRGIGADLSWQAWVGQAVQNLNHELANALARRGYLMQEVSVVFGRKEAAEYLLRKYIKQRLKQANTYQELQSLDQVVWQRFIRLDGPIL